MSNTDRASALTHLSRLALLTGFTEAARDLLECAEFARRGRPITRPLTLGPWLQSCRKKVSR